MKYGPLTKLTKSEIEEIVRDRDCRKEKEKWIKIAIVFLAGWGVGVICGVFTVLR